MSTLDIRWIYWDLFRAPFYVYQRYIGIYERYLFFLKTDEATRQHPLNLLTVRQSKNNRWNCKRRHLLIYELLHFLREGEKRLSTRNQRENLVFTLASVVDRALLGTYSVSIFFFRMRIGEATRLHPLKLLTARQSRNNRWNCV